MLAATCGTFRDGTGLNAYSRRASARAFAEHGAGLIVADVAVSSGEETVQLIESSGGTARFVETDVSYESMVATMVSTTVEEFGSVDYAVNNAGIHIEDEPVSSVVVARCQSERYATSSQVPIGVQNGNRLEISYMYAHFSSRTGFEHSHRYWNTWLNYRPVPIRPNESVKMEKPP
jgi:hypothetical protein